MRSSLRLGLLVLAGAISDALQLCAPAPSRAAAVYLPPPSSCALLGPRQRDSAIARSRTSRLKLCVVSSPVLEEASAADAAVPATSYPAVPTYRECLVFALNAVGIYAAPTLMSLIDAAFVGRVSTTQLAALGPAGSISDSVPFFMLFVSIAATYLVNPSGFGLGVGLGLGLRLRLLLRLG